MGGNRIGIKVKYEDETHRFSQRRGEESFDELKYKILVAFKYVKSVKEKSPKFSFIEDQMSFDRDNSVELEDATMAAKRKLISNFNVNLHVMPNTVSLANLDASQEHLITT